MTMNIDRWNAVTVDIDSLSKKVGFSPKTIKKHLKELEDVGAFVKVEGDIYHFDENMIFNPEHAPLSWLREVS